MVFPISEIAFEFVLLHCRMKQGKKFLNAKTKQAPRFCEIESPVEILRNYYLKGVREDSQLGLLEWLTGRYPLEGRLDIPSPREMLDIQCQGRRIATLLLRPEQQNTPIGRHAGAYEFLLHDLEHAHKFFGGEFKGQVRFFNLLRIAWERGHFQIFADDGKFQGELDYLMADMNSHPVHMLKYLKAIALSAIQRADLPADKVLQKWSEDLFELWGMPENTVTAALKINYPALETDFERRQVAAFFCEVP